MPKLVQAGFLHIVVVQGLLLLSIDCKNSYVGPIYGDNTVVYSFRCVQLADALLYVASARPHIIGVSSPTAKDVGKIGILDLSKNQSTLGRLRPGSERVVERFCAGVTITRHTNS